MARTSAPAVQAILGRNYDGSTDVGPFIDWAAGVVDQVILCAAGRGITHTSTALELMERWLAAHAYTLTDPLKTSKRTADASASYQTRDYLVMAKSLDSSGCVAGILSGKGGAGATWLGRAPSEQTAYLDRQ
jgi:hypothetical protein